MSEKKVEKKKFEKKMVEKLTWNQLKTTKKPKQHKTLIDGIESLVKHNYIEYFHLY